MLTVVHATIHVPINTVRALMGRAFARLRRQPWQTPRREARRRRRQQRKARRQLQRRPRVRHRHRQRHRHRRPAAATLTLPTRILNSAQLRTKSVASTLSAITTVTALIVARQSPLPLRVATTNYIIRVTRRLSRMFVPRSARRPRRRRNRQRLQQQRSPLQPLQRLQQRPLRARLLIAIRRVAFRMSVRTTFVLLEYHMIAPTQTLPASV